MSELADFVLGAFRQAGGIVEPPAYGIYEALLPEQVARRWNVRPISAWPLPTRPGGDRPKRGRHAWAMATRC